METVYLICFILGLVLSVLSFAGGLSHLHLGHFHISHTGHAHTHAGAHGLPLSTASPSPHSSAGSARQDIFSSATAASSRSLVLLLSIISGIIGATILWAVLFKLLLPRERVLTAEETEMPGVIAQVSDSIRDKDGIGEIIFSQTGARRSTAARSEDGTPIQRGTEVVVIRYERGVAYVRPFDDFSTSRPNELNNPVA